MNNKIIFLFSLIMLTAGTVLATENNDAYVKQIEYYKKMKTCTPYRTTFLGGFKYEVLGAKNGLCYIRQNDLGVITDCRFPKEVAIKFSNESIDTLNKSVTQGLGHSKYVNQIINDTRYCKVTVNR